MKVLVAGWFSFSNGHATVGDLLARDLVCEWLRLAGLAYDVALAPPFQGGVKLREVDPGKYSHAVFVCGPFQQGELEMEFLERFSACRLIGLNLSLPTPLETWNPWDFLIERDSSARAHPDFVFFSRQSQVPVVGVCLVENYPGAMVAEANAAVQRLLMTREVAVVAIDTRLDTNSTNLRTPAAIESLIARMDLVVTTRLHGTVLALKNGIPALMIDPEAGGAKLRRQADTIGWPVVFDVDTATDEALQQALDYCLTEQARTEARLCRDRAITIIETLRDTLVAALSEDEALEEAYQQRRATIEANHLVMAPGPATAPHASGVGRRIAQQVGNVRGLLRRVTRRK